MSVGGVMNLFAIPLILGAFLLVQQPSAQQLLDLTNFVDKEHRRLPPTHISGGGMGGGGTGVRKVFSPLKVSLALLKQDVSTGEIVYEVTILNSGKEEVQLPWDPDVADMEPKDDGWQKYSYSGFTIGLWAMNGNERIVLPNGIGLQMGHQAPNSSIPLKPGKGATIRAKTRLVLGNGVPGQRIALKAIYIPFTATVSIASSGEVYGDRRSDEGLISQNDVEVCYGECR
jgi:hypothetical protein